MIELIIAIGIIMLALSSIISLTIFNISTQQVSENKIIASNLAREGIEVVRHLRDSQRLSGVAFINAPFVPNQTDHTFIADFNRSTNTWTLDFSVNSINSAQIYLYDTDSVYVHNSVGATLTPFKRLLTVDYICANSAECGDGICEGSTLCSDVIGQRVTSRIEWDVRGSAKSFQLVNHLYEWK